MITKILAQIKDIKWGVTKEEFKKVFSDKQWVDYHPEEKNAITFVEIDNDIYIYTSISSFFIVDKLSKISLSFYGIDHQRLNDDISKNVFEKNKKYLTLIYGKPTYTNCRMPAELYVSKFINWKTENSTITLALQLSKDYNSLFLSKNILSDISTISTPPSVSIHIGDINKEKEINRYIANQSYAMEHAQKNELEKELEKIYVPMFQKTINASLSQAQDIFSDALSRAKKSSEKGDTANLPNNYGDIILKEELTNKKIKLGLDRKRAEGVTDKDIKWWWNTPDITRSMALEMDMIIKLATLHGLIEKNCLSEEEAWNKIPKYCPIFGDLYDSSDSAKKYEPLPFELKNRVNVYIGKRDKTDYEQFKKEMEDSPNFNSLIRREIKKGNL